MKTSSSVGDSTPQDESVTQLLVAWGDGNAEVFDDLAEAVYQDLRSMARRRLRSERPNHTLQPTALVNESFLRLVRQDRVEWHNRNQFFGVASQIMRRVLVDHARREQAAKRNGGLRITWPEDDRAPSPSSAKLGAAYLDILALDDVLGELAKLDPRQARIVELRYFAGLSIEETAALLEISPRTVKRDWQMARAWLKRELSGSAEGRGSDS